MLVLMLVVWLWQLAKNQTSLMALVLDRVTWIALRWRRMILLSQECCDAACRSMWLAPLTVALPRSQTVMRRVRTWIQITRCAQETVTLPWFNRSCTTSTSNKQSYMRWCNFVLANTFNFFFEESKVISCWMYCSFLKFNERALFINYYTMLSLYI